LSKYDFVTIFGQKYAPKSFPRLLPFPGILIPGYKFLTPAAFFEDIVYIYENLNK
jgi:hypothetical protein